MSETFYWTVVQAVLLFGEDTWVLLAGVPSKLERVHVGFLIQAMGQMAKRQRDGTRRSVIEAR